MIIDILTTKGFPTCSVFHVLDGNTSDWLVGKGDEFRWNPLTDGEPLRPTLGPLPFQENGAGCSAKFFPFELATTR